MGALLDAAAVWLLGATCPTCGSDAAGVCAVCRVVLAHPDPRRIPAPIPLVAAASYDGVWRGALVAFKERGARSLARPLGEALALAVAEAMSAAGPGPVPGAVVLVPMPSRAAAVRQRGEDTMRLMAVRAAACLGAAGLTVRIDPCLGHARRVADQAGLTVAQRSANLRGSLVARPRGGGVRVVVDDLTTTGASVGEAVRALRAAGGEVTAAAVVCAAERRDGRARW